VEYSIQRLMPVISREREKHRRRKLLLAEIRAHFSQGHKLLEKARAQLGPEDPLTSRLEEAAAFEAMIHESIERFVEKGSIIESY
jgi:hypothetical protein